MRTGLKRSGLCAGVALSAVALTSPAMSADHRDAPALTADPASDINDVFTFMDGGRFVMVMTVSPFAAATSKFSNATQYVFHTSSGPAFGGTTSDVNVICTFDAAQMASCWAGSDDYVTGDASKETGLTSTSGKMKVFAGLRGDPFFFNLQGFKDAVAAVVAATGLTPDSSGCPAVPMATVTALGGLLSETTSANDSTKTAADDFAKANTLAIALSVDVALVTKGGPIVSVWASTNKGS